MDQETAANADVIMGQFLHAPETVRMWESLARRGRSALVMNFDDDLFAVNRVEAHGSAYDDPDTVKRMMRMVELSDLVVVTTPELADVYDGFAPKIAILDNVIEDAFLQDELPERPENFTVGWTPSQSHNEDAEEFAPYLHEFLKRNPSARLRLYGPSEVSHPTPQIECIPWNKDMGGYVQSLNFHVGIAPLARNVFNKGKSGIKAIEYGARGIATVASDWPQYRRTVVERKTGYLVGSPEMMVSKLDYLLRHPGTVARMGRDARAYIGEHHTVRTRVLDWEKAFEGIVK